MRVYPNRLGAGLGTLVKDAAVVICLLGLAWVAVKLHDEIDGLKQLGSGVVQAGTSVQQGFGTAANAVAGVPIIGGQLSHGLRTAGASTGGAAAIAGHQAENGVEKAATATGWLVFLLPSAVLLAGYLPGRIRQIRQMTAAGRVLHASTQEPDRRLIAQRAAFALSYQQLLRHTTDPLEDLATGHYEPLIAAIFEDAGLRNPNR